jgi:two-component system, NarL family, sensor kinase
MLVFYLSLRMQKNKLKLQIQETNSAKKVMEIEEKEKERIAMELHDLTSPLFLTISRQIEELNTKDIGLKSGLQSKIFSLANAIRNISHRLKSMALDQIGFTGYLHGICEEMQKLTEVQIILGVHLMDLDLDNEIGKHILRIVQELLTNAVKYVKNGPIELSLSAEYHNLYVSYSDRGPGFDAEVSMYKGIGLINIFERVKLLKGKSELNTSPEKGTNWKIILPMDMGK